MSMYQDWIEAKEAERVAIDARRSLEDRMIQEFGIPETLEGTRSVDADGYRVKIVGRMNRKINGDLLQSVATEAGIEATLSTLFRWKPEIIAAAWKAADKSLTDILSEAIATEPGRPSFSIETIKEKE